jgi:hypothetical protein
MPAAPAISRLSFYLAEVTVEKTVTLMHNGESYDIPVEATFDAKIPEQIKPRTYEATFDGIVYSNEIRNVERLFCKKEAVKAIYHPPVLQMKKV